MSIQENGNYLIQIKNVPPRVCKVLFGLLKNNSSYSIQTTCSAEAGEILIEYNKT